MSDDTHSEPQSVWCFNGSNGSFPAGVFTSREQAELWIRKHKLTGTLTRYPLGVSVYDWAIQSGRFTPRSDEHRSPEFIQRFSSAMQEHFHYEQGI